jgi:hypothetical protein
MLSSAFPAPMKFEIQKLKGSSNYITWKASMTIYLDYYDCLEVVNGSEPCPIFDKDDKSSNAVLSLAAWKKKDKTAKMYMLISVSKDWVHIVLESSTSASCWSTLQEKFDRHNIISVHHLRFLINFKMYNSQSIEDYLTGYDQTWSRLKDQVQNADSDNKLADGLKTFLDSDTVKAPFLLLSLPESFANTVDTLTLRKDVTYKDVYTALLDLPSSSSSNSCTLTTLGKNKSKGKDKKKYSSHNQLGKNECSLCKKWNHPFTGHIYKSCKVLKDLKAGNTPVKSAPWSAIANMANDSSSAPSSSDHHLGVTFSAISTPSDGTALHSNIKSKQV